MGTDPVSADPDDHDGHAVHDVPAVDDIPAADKGFAPAAKNRGELAALLHKLQPAPPLPLDGPFTAGFGALISTWSHLQPDGVLGHPRVVRILSAVGRRLSITVSPEGITITGLVRRRDIPWDQVQEVRLETRYVLLRERVIAGAAEQLLTRGRIPVPGLGWLLRTLLGLLERLLPDGWRDNLSDEGGLALAVVVRRRARDVELTGLLALVAFLSEGLTAVVDEEAGRRGLLAPQD